MLQVKCRKCGSLSEIEAANHFKCEWCGTMNSRSNGRQNAQVYALMIVAAIIAVGILIEDIDMASGAASTPEQPQQVEDIDYFDIRLANEQLTSAARDEAFALLDGARVAWTGWVQDVTKNKYSDGYEIKIDMDPPSVAMSTHDVYLPVYDNAALNLKEDDVVEFEGTIERVYTYVGTRVRLKDVHWVER